MEKTILGEKIEGQGKTQAPCVLITGFEPFGGETVNPSWQAVERLPEQIRGRKVEKLLLPVTYGSSAQKLLEEIRRLEPEMVLCVGQAGGRAAVTVERTGINWAEASLADNDGYTALGETLEASGWDGYFSTLPLNHICMQPAFISAAAFSPGERPKDPRRVYSHSFLTGTGSGEKRRRSLAAGGA